MGPLKKLRRRVAKKKAEFRERCLVELCLNDVIDKHWQDADALMRQIDAKDSIFELERLRKLILNELDSDVLKPLEDSYPKGANGKMESRDSKLFKKELETLRKSVAEFDDMQNLKRLYYSGAVMEMYKRHNKALRKELQRNHRAFYLERKELQDEMERLEGLILERERENWCLEQVKLWEPEKYDHFERKPLALTTGGGQATASPYLDDHDIDGGMVRLIKTLNIPSQNEDIRTGGKVHADMISKTF